MADDQKPNDAEGGDPDGDSQETEESLASMTMTPIMESIYIEEDVTPGQPVRIIRPGWGSSGNYTPQSLRATAENGAFDGAHMYWDHRSPVERRERSLRNLAGIVRPGTAKYRESGPKGEGVYAEADVLPAYKESLEAMSEYIGLSIVGQGRTKQGTLEGRRGPIFHGALEIESVDYVTRPGAGGAIVTEFNSRKGMMDAPQKGKTKESDMPNTKTKEGADFRVNVSETTSAAIADEVVKAVEARFAGLEDGLKRLNEERTRDNHVRIAESALRQLDLPGPMQARVLESVMGDDRLLAENADMSAIVKDFAEREMRYVESLNPVMGSIYRADESLSDEKLDERIEENLNAIFDDGDEDDDKE